MSATVVDSLGSGLFLPFSIIFFLRTTPLSLTTVGLALSAAELLALPPLAVFGWMVDRLGPRTVVATGNLVEAAGFIGFLGVRNVWDLIALSLLVACGSGMFWTANPALMNLAADPGERFRWFGFSRALRNGGIGMGALLAAVAVSVGGAFGLRTLVAANAASFVIAAVMVMTWSPPTPENTVSATPGGDQRKPALASYWQVLKDGWFLLLLATNLVFVLCGDVLVLLLAVYIDKVLRAPLWIAGALFAVNTALVAVFQTTITRLVEHKVRTRVLQWAAGAWAAAFLFLGGLVAAPRVIVGAGLLAAITLFTLAEILEAPAMSELVVSSAPAASLGRYLGVNQMSWGIASAVSPVLFTWLLSRGPAWPWITLTVGCIFAALLLVPLGRQYQDERGPNGSVGAVPGRVG